MKVIELCSFSGGITVLLDEEEDAREVDKIMQQVGYRLTTVGGRNLPIVKMTNDGAVCWFTKI